MKTKEIQVGVPYIQRGVVGGWGVPVTTENLYAFPSYRASSRDYLYSGKGILVLVNSRPVVLGKGESQPEDAIKALKTLKDPGVGSIKDFLLSLNRKGLTVEIWLPREFKGPMDEVKKQQEEERARGERYREEKEASRQSLMSQFEALQKDLGISTNAYFNPDKSTVSMNFSEWKKMMSRVESLLQSDPLNTGML